MSNAKKMSDRPLIGFAEELRRILFEDENINGNQRENKSADIDNGGRHFKEDCRRDYVLLTPFCRFRYDPAQNHREIRDIDSEDDSNDEMQLSSYEKSRREYESIGLKSNLANSFYRQGKYEAALSHYSRLVEMCPKNATNYNNRSACYLMLEKYTDAFTDAKTVIQLEPSNIKAHSRLIKCATLLGDLASLEYYINRLSEIDCTREDIAPARQNLDVLKKHTTAESKARNVKNYTNALEIINKCLLISPHSSQFKLRKVEYLLYSKRNDEADQMLQEILQNDPNNSEANYLKALRIYHSDVMPAVNFLKTILRDDPDNTRARELYKKARDIADRESEARRLLGNGNFAKAHEVFSLAIEIDPDHVLMRQDFYNLMGRASVGLKNFQRATEEFTKSLEINSNQIDVLQQRAECYMNMKDYLMAIEDFSRVCSMCPRMTNCATRIKDAEKLLTSENRDDYQILALNRNATVEDLKKAYKYKAMVHHPDKHSNNTPQMRRMHEKEFKKINSSYQKLLQILKLN